MAIEARPRVDHGSIPGLPAEAPKTPDTGLRDAVLDNIDLSQARPTPLMEQGTVISSSPGLDIIELPVERFVFGEYSTRNETHKQLLEQIDIPLSDHAMQMPGNPELEQARSEYRRHLKDKRNGIVHKQRFERHTFPSWDASLRRSDNVFDFSSRRSDQSPQTGDEQPAEAAVKKIA